MWHVSSPGGGDGCEIGGPLVRITVAVSIAASEISLRKCDSKSFRMRCGDRGKLGVR